MEKGRIIRSVGTISGFTSLSRVLGLVRDILMAGAFGTSLVMSAFVLAFRVPNLFRKLFGEGALSSAFIPVLVETREKRGDAESWVLVNRVLSLLAVVLSLVAVAVILFSMSVTVENSKIAAVLEMLQIMMPYMVFICLAAISMGVLNSFHHFAVSSFAPCILNILWIFALLFVVPAVGQSPEEKITCVAWVVLLAGFLQWAVQWPMLRHFGWKPSFSISWRDEQVKKILLLMGPTALGMAVFQINVMMDGILAMWVSSVAPSALYYSERLIYLPLGVFATALSTVLLPVFSGHAARKDHAQIQSGLTDGIRHLFFVMIPASVGLLVMSVPIVRMIFEWKQFGATSTWMTSVALQCYAPGLVVFSITKIFVSAFYGMQDTRTPVRIGVVAVLLNLMFNILFILTLPQDIKHAGIAFATVLSSAFNMICLAVVFQRRIGPLDWAAVMRSGLRSLVSSVIMACSVFLFYRLLTAAVPSGLSGVMSKVGQIAVVLTSVAAGSGIYLILSFLVKSSELHELIKAVRSRKNGRA